MKARNLRKAGFYLAALVLMSIAFFLVYLTDNGEGNQVLTIGFIFIVEESLEYALKKFCSHEGHQSLT